MTSKTPFTLFWHLVLENPHLLGKYESATRQMIKSGSGNMRVLRVSLQQRARKSHGMQGKQEQTGSTH